METKISFKGIIPKTEDEKDLFIVRFEAKCGNWRDALNSKEIIEEKLEKIITGQKTLEVE